VGGTPRLAACSAALLAAAVALHPVLEPDLWWHLASGRWILEHREIPRADVFTYSMPGRAWVNLQWLFDVGAARLWAWGGPDALVLAKAAALAGVAALGVAAASAAGAGPGAAAVAAGLAVLASAERTTERPEIATYLALASLVLLVERARRGAPRRELALAPAIVAVWINVHSLAFLGPVLLLLHAAVAAVPPPGATPGRARALAAAGAAAALALLANPWGIAAWTFPWTLLRRIGAGPDVFHRILEFAPPSTEPGDPALRFFWILLGVTALSFALRAPRVPWRRAAALAPFLALALMARRNVPLFAIVVVPVLAENLGAAASRLAGGSPRAARAASRAAPFALLGLAAAVLGGASGTLLGLPRERGLGVMPGLFPEDALAAADRLGLHGRLFHDLDFGGYVAWRSPERKTFIDGRLEVVGPEDLARFVAAHESPAAWERLDAVWRFDLLLLEHSARGSAALLRALLAGGAWAPVHESAEAVLLASRGIAADLDLRARSPAPAWEELLAARRGPAPGAGEALAFVARPLDDLLRPRPAPSAVRRAARFANLQLTLDRVATAREGYDAILRVAPADPEALFNRGLCALREGRPAEAKARWEAALPRVGVAHREPFLRGLEQLGS